MKLKEKNRGIFFKKKDNGIEKKNEELNCSYEH